MKREEFVRENKKKKLSSVRRTVSMRREDNSVLRRELVVRRERST